METNIGIGKKLAFAPLEKEETAEIAVIGGGMCGLLAAYLFSKEGKKVSVYERHYFGEGYSVKMPDILQYDADRSLAGLKNACGYAAASEYYKLCLSSLSEIKNAAEETGAAVTVKDCFSFSDGKISDAEVENEYRLRKYSGIDVEIIDGKEGLDLFSFPFQSGIYTSKGGLYIDKNEFTEKMLCYLSVKGVNLYENTEIEYVTQKENGDGYYLETDDGISAFAEKVIDCRGLSLLSRYPFLGRRQAVFFIKTSPVTNFEGWYNRAFVRDMYLNPVYFLPDPEGKVTCCGSDAFFPSKQDGVFGGIFKKLKEKRTEGLKDALTETFYSLDGYGYEKADFSAFLRTRSMLPVSKEDPIRKNYFYLAAGNRNTLLSSYLAAKCAVSAANGLFPAEYSLLRDF